MEIDVTNLVKECKYSTYANSIAKSGKEDIGQLTWRNAKNSKIKLVNKANKKEIIEYFKDYGAWEDIHRWTIKELNALLIQEVSISLNDIGDSMVDYRLYVYKDKWYYNIGR